MYPMPVTDLPGRGRADAPRGSDAPSRSAFAATLEASYRGLRVQEFAEDAEICFRASGECCFDIDTLERGCASVASPAADAARRRAAASGFRRMPDSGYIVAVDPAGGGPDSATTPPCR